MRPDRGARRPREGGAMKEEMLARLVAQAEGAPMDIVMIRALIEEASELGAGRALARLGLGDRRAEADMRELRELLRAWRDAKKAARGAAIGWAVRIVMALVLLGICSCRHRAMARRCRLFGRMRGDHRQPTCT